ncbi:hypothetical protein HNQ94_000271 [Salirhabdus euzebyi]|uniref:Uncharacterized protein n=1 Tax=Salirhabdus euzebyi TaxID=394506 RepID=A0A841PSU5_9BACI|nr:hypothetical protein [Salirhabdus euzebyi]
MKKLAENKYGIKVTKALINIAIISSLLVGLTSGFKVH